jgi:hypothetical protein
MDEKYLQIKIKNIKSDLDTVITWFASDETEKAQEYLDDCIKVIKELKKKL